MRRTFSILLMILSIVACGNPNKVNITNYPSPTRIQPSPTPAELTSTPEPLGLTNIIQKCVVAAGNYTVADDNHTLFLDGINYEDKSVIVRNGFDNSQLSVADRYDAIKQLASKYSIAIPEVSNVNDLSQDWFDDAVNYIRRSKLRSDMERQFAVHLSNADKSGETQVLNNDEIERQYFSALLYMLINDGTFVLRQDMPGINFYKNSTVEASMYSNSQLRVYDALKELSTKYNVKLPRLADFKPENFTQYWVNSIIRNIQNNKLFDDFRYNWQKDAYQTRLDWANKILFGSNTKINWTTEQWNAEWEKSAEAQPWSYENFNRQYNSALADFMFGDNLFVLKENKASDGVNFNSADYNFAALPRGIPYEQMTCVFDQFNLPAYIRMRMWQTREVDGTQFEQYQEMRIWWTYTPDEGLNVTITNLR